MREDRTNVGQYFQARDPVSGTVYYLTLVLFALMPLLVKPRARLGVRKLIRSGESTCNPGVIGV